VQEIAITAVTLATSRIFIGDFCYGLLRLLRFPAGYLNPFFPKIAKDGPPATAHRRFNLQIPVIPPLKLLLKQWTLCARNSRYSRYPCYKPHFHWRFLLRAITGYGIQVVPKNCTRVGSTVRWDLSAPERPDYPQNGLDTCPPGWLGTTRCPRSRPDPSRCAHAHGSKPDPSLPLRVSPAALRLAPLTSRVTRWAHARITAQIVKEPGSGCLGSRCGSIALFKSNIYSRNNTISKQL
jgi:hypothetical protein